MGYIGKGFTLIVILLLLASSLTGYSVSGQSLKPVVTDFSLKYVDNSYDVPPQYKYSKDLYTCETITTTIPGYHVENKSIVVTIKNPPGVDAYNFRWKPHRDNSWNYLPFDTEADTTPPLSASGWSGPPGYASDLDYTVLSVISLNHISVTSFDFQVQALYGKYHAEHYTHVQPGIGETYDFYFDGQASYWSNTQTITISEDPTAQITTAPPTPFPTAASPYPTQTPMTNSNGNSFGFDLMQTVMVLAVVVAILVVVIVLAFRNHRKPK